MGIRTHRDTASFPLRDTQQFDIKILAIGIAIDFDRLVQRVASANTLD
jgi:hypothetical protein